MLVSVASVCGVPGVSAAALALAVTWPAPVPVLLAEADSSGGDLAVRHGLSPDPGLATLGAAARHRAADPQLAAGHAQLLPGGLAVIVGPPGAGQARAAVDAAGPALVSAATRRTVIADLGRLSPGGQGQALVRGADVLLLVARPVAEQIAHVQAAGWLTGAHPRVRLLLTGPGYRAAEVAAACGIRVAGVLPGDPKAVAGLEGARVRGLARLPLIRAAARLAAELSTTSTTPTTATATAAPSWRGYGPPPPGPPPATGPSGPSMVSSVSSGFGTRAAAPLDADRRGGGARVAGGGDGR